MRINNLMVKRRLVKRSSDGGTRELDTPKGTNQVDVLGEGPYKSSHSGQTSPRECRYISSHPQDEILKERNKGIKTRSSFIEEALIALVPQIELRNNKIK